MSRLKRELDAEYLLLLLLDYLVGLLNVRP